MFAVLASLLSGPAHAERPTLEVLDDIERWESGQDELLAGPAGCWDLEGEARQVATLHQPPDFFSAARNERLEMTGSIRGRLVDGHWVDGVTVAMKPVDHELDLSVPIYPLFGSMPKPEKGGRDEAISISVRNGEPGQVSAGLGHSVNLLREAVEQWSGSVETSLAQWDESQSAVLYLRELPLSDRDPRPVKVSVRFPDAGPADRIDAVWPKLVKVGEWPLRGKIRDAQMHAVGHRYGKDVLPWAESLSFVAGMWGFTIGFEQSVRWLSATPCSSVE